jgi:predicted Fe-Mo cluster-binding NifX family protein
MKVAIPVFGPRVSPRFDCAPRLLLLTLQDGKIVERQELHLIPSGPWQRVEKLKELGVQALICGGIDVNSAQLLNNHQIQVIGWVAGEVEEALKYFLRGKLRPGSALCPGGARERRRCRKAFSNRRKN